MNVDKAREMQRNGASPMDVLAQFTDVRLGEAVDSRGEHVRVAPEQVQERIQQLQEQHGETLESIRVIGTERFVNTREP